MWPSVRKEEKEPMHRRVQSRELTVELARQIDTGQKGPAQVCHEHNLSEGVLLHSRREDEAGGEEAFTAELLFKAEALEPKVAKLER
jgi:hypothetical protein